MTKYLYPFFCFFLFFSCATYQKTDNNNNYTFESQNNDKNIFLVGDAGYTKDGKTFSATLKGVQKTLQQSKGDDYVIFLGDNIYPKGFDVSNKENKKLSKAILDAQINAVKKEAKQVFFIPGNHDWYNGLDGLKKQEKWVEKRLGKKAFLPDNGCPLDKEDIDDHTILITVDSEWYITNWNKHPKINDKCKYIKTRAKFWEEFKGLINKNQNKNVILAIHHPVFSQGSHGGHYAFNSLQLPILNVPINLLRKTSGISPADLQHPQYRKLANRIKTILHNYPNVWVVSGHEHSLQLIEKDNVKQIISGSGSKTNAVKKDKSLVYAYPDLGFSVLQFKENQSQQVSFFDHSGNTLFQKQYNVNSIVENTNFSPIQKEYKASIYPKKEKKKRTEKYLSKINRKYYYKDVSVPAANLEKLYGGLEIVRKGGGNQSVSFRLKDKENKQYVMRRMRKSATQFIQVKAFTENYKQDQLKNSFAERLLLDFYTTSYPFAALAIPELSKAANVYHTNPKLFYVPKQKRLKQYNDFANELYLVEERVEKGWKNETFFGKPDDIVSTDDFLRKIHNNPKHQIDVDWYIKTRLFDMLLGDWDRHEDQYRWAKYKKNNRTIYRPIPRDRDQAFPNFDAFLLQASTRLIPALRLMQSFDEDIRNIKTFNQVIYRLDLPLLASSTAKQWQQQAEILKNNITDEVIEKAFANIPPEAQDENLESIKNKIKKRREKLSQWASEYYLHLSQTAVITASNQKDKITVTQQENSVLVEINQGKRDKPYFNKQFLDQETKEIWIYGLDDDDTFTVTGKPKTNIKTTLIGGQNHDQYFVENKKGVSIFDQKSTPNTIHNKNVKHRLTDDYYTNAYDHTKFKNTVYQTLPMLSFDPDGGLQPGVSFTRTSYNFKRNPFSNQHKIKGKYFSATNGFAFSYHGEFAEVVGNLNVGISAAYSTPNFAFNFFGFGNETLNETDANGEIFEMDYYRVRLQEIKTGLSLIRRGTLGSILKLEIPYEVFKIENTANRIVSTLSPQELDRKSYTGLGLSYAYTNFNRPGFPSLGLSFKLDTGYRTQISDFDQDFFYLEPALTVYHPLLASEKLVFSTNLNARLLFGGGYNLNQSAQIGGNFGLRGLRNQRFTGDKSFYANNSIHWTVGNINNGFLPMKYGFTAGFDVGRVWLDNENSTIWHNSSGLGFWVNSLDLLTLNTSYFLSEDGGRFVFGLGLSL